MLEIVDTGIISCVPGRSAYMPVITPLSDGTFISCQHVGRRLLSPDNHIEVLRSQDGGKTWTNEGSIHDGGLPADGKVYRGPGISEVPDGGLVMTATRWEMSAELFDVESESVARPEMLLLWSTDRGRTWSEPQVVPVGLPPEKYACNGAGALLQLAPDRWMYPLETWKPVEYEGPPDQKAAVVFDAGTEATLGVPQHESFMAEYMLIAFGKPGGVLLPDGDLLTYFWCTSGGVTHTRWVRLRVESRREALPSCVGRRQEQSTP